MNLRQYLILKLYGYVVFDPTLISTVFNLKSISAVFNPKLLSAALSMENMTLLALDEAVCYNNVHQVDWFALCSPGGAREADGVAAGFITAAAATAVDVDAAEPASAVTAAAATAAAASCFHSG